MKEEATREEFKTINNAAKQVKKESGLFYHHNLDSISFKALQEASANLKESRIPMSHSVIVRRALRIYAAITGKLSDMQKVEEGYQLLRAAKGT